MPATVGRWIEPYPSTTSRFLPGVKGAGFRDQGLGFRAIFLSFLPLALASRLGLTVAGVGVGGGGVAGAGLTRSQCHALL